MSDDGPDIAPLAQAHSQKNGIWDPKAGLNVSRVAQHGFTIPDLINLGAVADGKEEDVRPNDLKGSIHPAFAFEKWEKSVPSHFKRSCLYRVRPDPNGEPRSGRYTVDNPIVWKVLEPCLKLVSKFVNNAHLFPWYDALLHGEIKPISNTTAEARKRTSPLQSVLLRSESDLKDPASVSATRKRIAAITKRIRLGISDGQADPMGFKTYSIHYDGMTIPLWEDDSETYRIYVAFQAIEILLLDDLAPSTRLALEFHIAVTLLHKFAHILVFSRSPSHHSPLYFEDERMIEAGKSFEVYTFGGHPVLLLQVDYKTHYKGGVRAGFLLEDWLGKPKGTQSLAPMSGTDKDWNDREWRECRSIPLSFLEELGQEDFWRCFVGKWGAEALKVYPWTEGRLVRKCGNNFDTRILAPPDKYPPWLQEALRLSPTNSKLVTGNEVLAIQFANKRVSRGQSIANAVEVRRKGNQQPKTPPIVMRKEELSRVMLEKKDNSPNENPAKSAEERPWDARARDITGQRDAVSAWSKLCMTAEARVHHFIARMDFESPDYEETKRGLMKLNTNDCKKLRSWIEIAFDEELVTAYERLLLRFEKLKNLLGRESRQSSEDREISKEQEATHDECVTLLKRAEAYHNRRENQKCTEVCNEVLSRKHASQYNKAEVNILLSLCTADDTELKVWYASEAVRICKLDQYKKKRSIEPTLDMKEKLAYAEECLKAAKAAYDAAKSVTPPQQTGSKFVRPLNPVTPRSSPKAGDTTPSSLKTTNYSPEIRSKPTTPPQQNGPKFIKPATPSTSPRAGRTTPSSSHTTVSSPPTRSNLPPNTTPTPTRPHLDLAPPGLTPAEIQAHRRTFRTINSARRAFHAGNFSLSELTCLELLRVPDTSIWQQARAHVFLARIPWRHDRVERAGMALAIYRVVEGMHRGGRNESRARDARVQAEGFERAMVVSVERGAGRGVVRRGEGGVAATVDSLKGVGLQMTGERMCGGKIDVVSDGEETEWSRNQRASQSGDGNQRGGFVAGVVNKFKSILGIKRRRDEDDDGENDRGGRERRVSRFA